MHGNPTNALLNNKTFGVGMASETGKDLKESRHILSGQMSIIIEGKKQSKLRTVVDIICKGTGQSRRGINRDPRSLFPMHSAQLSIEDHGRSDGSNRREKCENSGSEESYNSGLFALGAQALLGIAAAAISVYCICYFSGALLILGGIWEFAGDVTFLRGRPKMN
jgi:hypothetical protein